MTVDKRERDRESSIPGLRPKRETKLTLTIYVTRLGINCWIERYGSSLTLPVMCWAYREVGG
jgi:hypothetical protein